VEPINKQKVDRKQFITYIAAGALAVTGIGGIVELVKGKGTPAKLINTSLFEKLANKNRPNGYAGLNAQGQIPLSLLPSSTSSIGSITKLSGLSDVSVSSPSSGQVLTYSSTTNTWSNQTLPITTSSNSITTVTSVAGKTGVVVLSPSDITGLTSALNNINTGLGNKVQIGGDLGGSITSPIIKSINGISLPSGSPVSGNVLTATSSTTTTWSTPAGGVMLDASASDIQPDTTSGTAVAGNTGKAADAGHQHTLVAHDHSTTNKGGNITPTTGLATSGTASNTTYLRGDNSWATPIAGAQALVPTSVKTSAYTASPGNFVPVDASGGNVIITLPTAPADESRIEIKMINTNGSYTVTVNTGGSDVFNITSGSTTAILSLLNQAVMLQYDAGTSIWYVQSDDIPLSQLDARYPQTGQYVPIAGGTMTGALGINYTGSSTSASFSEKLSTDPYPRWTIQGQGFLDVGSPYAPANWGTHVNGDVGGGSDFQWGFESLSDTANMFYLTFPRVHMTDGSHYLYLSSSVTFPLTGSPTIQVTSIAGLAASGSLTVNSPSLGTGTITYNSTSQVSNGYGGYNYYLVGCSSSGLTSSTDISQRHAFWLTDSFGAPIWWISDYNGMYLNDQYNVAANGVFTDYFNDITLGFATTSSGGEIRSPLTGWVSGSTGLSAATALQFGRNSSNGGSGSNGWSSGSATSALSISRYNDPYSNGYLIFSVGGGVNGSQTFHMGAPGFYPATAVSLGSTYNPWSHLYLTSATAAVPSLASAADSTTGIYFPAAGSLGLSTSGTETILISALGLTFVSDTTSTSTTGNTLTFGSDGGASISRGNDGFGDPQLVLYTTGIGGTQQIVWDSAGFYASVARNLGTSGNHWGTAYLTTALTANGTAPLPSQAFNNDNTTGHYLISAGNLGVSASGANVATWSSAGLTMAEPIAMSSNKITGIANGSVATDAAAFGQLPTLPISIANGGLGSSNITTKNTSALPYTTLYTDRTVILTGSTTGQTVTLGTTTVATGQTTTIVNESSVSVTLAAHSGTIDTTTLGSGDSVDFNFDGTNFQTLSYSGVNKIGQQVAYNQVTGNMVNTPATQSTWYIASNTSGTAPSITLPADGNKYKVEFLSTFINTSVSGQIWLGIGTATTNILASRQMQTGSGLPAYGSTNLTIPNLVGTGQTISVYTASVSASNTVTIEAAAGPGAVTPASLAAYRVA
jgi:hypothetical protein